MASPKRAAGSVPKKVETGSTGVVRDARGRIVSGILSPNTIYKPGQSGNDQGMRHAVRCAKLIEQLAVDEAIAKLAAGKGRKVTAQAQVQAYAEICAQAYGRPGTVQIANINRNEVIVKRVIGIDDKLL